MTSNIYALYAIPENSYHQQTIENKLNRYSKRIMEDGIICYDTLPLKDEIDLMHRQIENQNKTIENQNKIIENLNQDLQNVKYELNDYKILIIFYQCFQRLEADNKVDRNKQVVKKLIQDRTNMCHPRPITKKMLDNFMKIVINYNGDELNDEEKTTIIGIFQMYKMFYL